MRNLCFCAKCGLCEIKMRCVEFREKKGQNRVSTSVRLCPDVHSFIANYRVI